MLPYTIYDVFTDTPFAGNPLAIVMEADGLSTWQMQTIAREFNLSETLFIRTPKDLKNTAAVRIFFPTAEIPFAGHPTIGCAVHLAKTRKLTHVILEEQAGLVPVTIEGKRAEFKAPIVPTAMDLDVAPEQCAQMLGLTRSDVGPHMPGSFQGGPTFLYIPVRTEAALAKAQPREPYWSQVLGSKSDSAYLYTPNFNTRMFAPGGGIPEDPATGSAAAILAAQLLANDALSEGRTKLNLRQGVAMGRPSEICFSADTAGGALKAVYISGSAVQIATGFIHPPKED